MKCPPDLDACIPDSDVDLEDCGVFRSWCLSGRSRSMGWDLRFCCLDPLLVASQLPEWECNVTSQLPVPATVTSLPVAMPSQPWALFLWNTKAKEQNQTSILLFCLGFCYCCCLCSVILVKVFCHSNRKEVHTPSFTFQGFCGCFNRHYI